VNRVPDTFTLTDSPFPAYNPFQKHEGGFAMKGSVRCIHCKAGIDENGDGICPKCKAAKGYWIDIYWSKKYHGDGEHYAFRYGLDWAYTKAKLFELRSSITEGRFNPRDATNLTNLFELRAEEWFSDLEKAVRRGDLAPATFATYKFTLRGLLSTLGKLDVAKIDYQALKDCFDDLPGRGSSKKTIRSNLHTFFVWCRRQKHIANIPPFPTVKATGKKMKYVLTREQQEEAVSRLPILQDAFRLMMCSGVRPSEVLLIKLSDISVERRCITINRTYSDKTIKESTKTNKPRTLPMSSAAWEIVLQNIRNRIGDCYLFCKPDGSPYSYEYLWATWKRHSGYAVPPKDAARRSWATRMRNAGVDMDAIRQGLGHATLQVTKEYLENDVEWAAEQFDKAEGKVIHLRNESETVSDGKAQ
jgi:integrase